MKWSFFVGVILFLVVFAFLGCTGNEKISSSDKKDSESTSMNDEVNSKKIDKIFEDYLNEKFIDQGRIRAVSGWTKQLPSGKYITRDNLQRQAAPLIALGRDAIPHLYLWTVHDYPYIQYIAEYSLYQIDASFPRQDENVKDSTEDNEFNRKWKERNYLIDKELWDDNLSYRNAVCSVIKYSDNILTCNYIIWPLKLVKKCVLPHHNLYCIYDEEGLHFMPLVYPACGPWFLEEVLSVKEITDKKIEKEIKYNVTGQPTDNRVGGHELLTWESKSKWIVVEYHKERILVVLE